MTTSMNAAVGFPSIALHNLPPRKRLAAQLRFDKATVASASGVTTRRSRRRRDAETRAAEARASLAKNITGIRRARGRENDDDGFLNEGLAQRAKRALASLGLGGEMRRRAAMAETNANGEALTPEAASALAAAKAKGDRAFAARHAAVAAAEIAREKAQAARELMLVLARTKEQAEELLSSRTFIT
jgi:hypothetical protein